MKKLINEININSLQEAEEILKSAGTEDLFEKAKHNDGDMHPNGKWVWVSSANGGKGDWRTNNGRAHKKHSAGGNAGTGSTAKKKVIKQTEDDKTPEKKQKKQNENTNSSANVSVEGLEKTLDGIDGAEVKSVKYKPTVLLQPAVRNRWGRVVKPAITENPDLPYIDIRIDDKKSLDQAIEAINKKYGVKITKDDFDHNRSFGGSLYTISVNPKTGEFGHPHRGFTNKMMDDYKKEWKKKQKDR